VEDVQGHLAEVGGLKPATFESFCDIWHLFARFCEQGLGLTDADEVTKDDVVAFLVAPRAQGGELADASRHFRRGAVRFLYRRGRKLGLVSGDPTLDVILPKRPVLSTRPLTDDESELCRLCALGTMSDLRLPLVWALAEATARISEIPNVRVRDLDTAARVVFLAGGARTDPRWAPMTDWASAQLRRRLTTPELPRDPGSLVVPWRPKITKRPGNAATMAVIEVLRTAGIHGDPSVRPTSVTAWAGRRLLLRGFRIEEVACALGCRSLDRTAHLIGLDWRNPPQDGPA